jgi:hypothetical protein
MLPSTLPVPYTTLAGREIHYLLTVKPEPVTEGCRGFGVEMVLDQEHPGTGVEAAVDLLRRCPDRDGAEEAELLRGRYI